jgi:hypothetical protein
MGKRAKMCEEMAPLMAATPSAPTGYSAKTPSKPHKNGSKNDDRAEKVRQALRTSR